MHSSTEVVRDRRGERDAARRRTRDDARPRPDGERRPPPSGRPDPLRPIAPQLADEVFAAWSGEPGEATRALLAAAPGTGRAFRRQIDHILIGLAEGLRRGERTINPKKIALASPIGVLAADVPVEVLRGAWDDLFEAFAVRLPRIAATLAGPSDVPALTVLLHRAISARSHVCTDWHGTAREHRAEQATRDERRRIARELHDWFGSNLSLAARRLELYRAAPEERHVEAVEKVVGDLFQGVRRYAAGLRAQEPVGDLAGELRAFVRESGRRGPRVEVMVRGEDRDLTAVVRDELYAVLREAVRNVYAHADAGHATVMVEISADRVCAVVQDDGVGLDAGVRGPDSTGLVSMRERVDALDGQIMLTGAPGEGTRVELWIPMRGNR